MLDFKSNLQLTLIVLGILNVMYLLSFTVRTWIAGDEDQLPDGNSEADESYRQKDIKCFDADSCDEYCSSKWGEKCQGEQTQQQLVSSENQHHILLTSEFDEASMSEDPRKLDKESQFRNERKVQTRQWTDKDRESFARRPLPVVPDRRDFELLAHEAQNSSLCNYTVIPIPNPGGRIPRELEHVKCNHVGMRCQEMGMYCCIQLIRYVEVVYESNNSTKKIKVYSGCVCSLQIYGYLDPYTPKLAIDY